MSRDIVMGGLLCAIALCASPALAASAPSMNVFLNSNWSTTVSGDDSGAGPLVGDNYISLNWTANAPVPSAKAVFGLPGGMDSPQVSMGCYMDWDSAKGALKFRTTGPLPQQNDSGPGVSINPSQATLTPAVSVSRSVDDPIFPVGVASKTLNMVVNVQVQSSLASYGNLSIRSIDSHNMPDGYSCSVISASGPGGFYNTGDPGSFYTFDTASLGVGNTCSFTVQMQVTRNNGTDTAAYFKPPVGVSYMNTVNASGTGSYIAGLGSGLSATVSNPSSAVILANVGSDSHTVQLAAASGNVGPAQPFEIDMIRNKRKSISGQTLYDADFWLTGENLVGGVVTLPNGTAVNLYRDRDQLVLRRTAGDEASLAGFGAGVYQVALTGTDGTVRRFTLNMPAGTCPGEFPTLSQPTGFRTMSQRPTVSWAAPTDPGVNGIHVSVETGLGKYETLGSLSSVGSSYQVPENQVLGAGMGQVTFANVTQGVGGGFNFMAGYATSTDTYFNVATGGDSNLDGVVDVLDLGVLATNWQKTGATWQDGDFNGDGKVDVLDLGILATNWQSTGGSFADAVNQAFAVPEPVTMALLTLGALGLLRRGKR